SIISPSKQGTGQGGAELKRKEAAEPGTYVARSYYYREAAKPEPRFKGHTEYRVTIDGDRLFDLAQSPLPATLAEKKAKRDGYIGAYNSEGAMPDAVMLFHDQQVDTPEKTTLTTGGVKYSLKAGAEPQPVFYHQIQRALSAKMPNRASVEQVRGIIKGSQIKQDEVLWSGVELFLAGKLMVEKKELLDYLEGNQITVNEVIKASAGYDENDRLKVEEASNVQYEQYIEEGPARHYREILLTLPTDTHLINGSYDSHHWGDNKNVIAHARVTTRINDEYQKVLFIEEIQSDWHQAGRRVGYQASLQEVNKVTADVNRLRSPIVGIIEDKLGNLGFDTTNEALAVIIADDKYSTNWDFGELANEERASIETWRRAVIKNNEIKLRHSAGIPAAPFSKTWPELVAKRLLRLAADEGFDAIAWTTSEMQNARYNLVKKISKIKAIVSNLVGEDKNNRTVLITAYNTNDTTVLAKTFESRELPDVVGKELATKIVAQTPGDESIYKGLDLEVGGSGMKEFYDKIIPSFFNKYLKQFDGEVSDINLQLQPEKPKWAHDTYVGPDYSLAELVVKQLEPDNATSGGLGVVIEGQIRDVAGAMNSGETFKEAMGDHASFALAEMLGGKMVRSDQIKYEGVPGVIMTQKMKDLSKSSQPVFSRKSKPLQRFLKGSTVKSIVYHGTTRDFDMFHLPSSGLNSSLFGNWATKRYAAFFAEEPALATEFSNQGAEDEQAIGQRLIPAYISLKNPLDFKAGITNAQIEALNKVGLDGHYIARQRADEAWELFDEDQQGEETVAKMKQAGFDGAVLLEHSYTRVRNTTSYAIFSSEQAKSATG
ncbi:MAG: hypothetical protein ACRD2L_07380, partial [Terriglobia bacterium]